MNSRKFCSIPALEGFNLNSLTIRFNITECWPTDCLTPAESYITIAASTAEILKYMDDIPEVMAIEVARAQTVAVCELGIPPLVTK